MQRAPLALLFALAAGAAPAQVGNPMQSADCRRALESLQAQEAVVIASRHADGAGKEADDHRPPSSGSPLDELRRHAARACLGGTGDPPPPKQIALPPIVVSPIVISRPVLPLPKIAAPAAAAPQRIEPPVLISTCDAGGCWASDGTRLNRVGSNLMGPRGLCNGLPGMPLTCP